MFFRVLTWNKWSDAARAAALAARQAKAKGGASKKATKSGGPGSPQAKGFIGPRIPEPEVKTVVIGGKEMPVLSGSQIVKARKAATKSEKEAQRARDKALSNYTRDPITGAAIPTPGHPDYQPGAAVQQMDTSQQEQWSKRMRSLKRKKG